MGRLDSNTALQTALHNNDPFLYAHLVKFERPLVQVIDLPNGQIRYETDATRYAYVTDAAYDINFDDGSTNLAGTSNGAQTYQANKLVKVGSVSESTTIKIGSLNLTLDATGVDASIEGTFTITTAGVITVTSGLGFAEAGFQEGDRVKFSLGNNSTKYFRLTSFYTDPVSGNPAAQATLLTLKDASGNTITIAGQSNFSATLSSESDEILAILRDIKPTHFVNRGVSIYKVFLNAENPSIFIGTPVLLFKGIITTANYKETDKKATMSWGLKSHWGDFQQVRGRLTSDDFHRALKPNEQGQLVGNPQATIRPEYWNDLGFAHSEQAVNVIGTYITQETRYKMTKHGLFKLKSKMHEYEVDVEKEVDLRFDLQAKYLPVIYGVRRINGNLVFADTNATNANEIFIGEAICEGPIHGLYNVYIEDNSLICVDKPDADIRDGGAEAVDVVCIGRTDKGEVMEGTGVAHTSGNLVEYILANDATLSRDWANAGTVEAVVHQHRYLSGHRRKANTSGLGFAAGDLGIVHDQGFKISKPTAVDIEFKAGKAEQEASSILLTQANGAGFKLEKDYYGDDLSYDYWSEDHRLLDTAYIVTKTTLTEEQTTVPELEFVVKGKIIDCYNYDGSFTHDPNPSYNTEIQTAFDLGDVVDIKNSSDTVIADDVMIIDKWSFDAGEYAKSAERSGWRFRWNLTSAEQTALNSAGSFYMTNGTNTWHMLTHEYKLDGFKVKETPVVDVTSVESSGDDPLVAVLASPLGPSDTFESIMASYGVDMATLMNGVSFSNIGNIYSGGYNAGNHQVTLNDSSSAGATPTNTSLAVLNKFAITADGDTPSSVNDYYNGATVILTKDLGDGNELDITRTVKDYIVDTSTNPDTYIITVDEPFTLTANEGDIPLLPVVNDKVTIVRGQDKRVSTNLALITYDYLTSNIYGPGVKQEDINQNSFLNSAITCDTGSDITVTLATAATVKKGAVYKWVSGVFKWQGTVKTDATSSTSITFENCIGKLTSKWNNWKTREIGDVVWTHIGGNQQLRQLTAQGYQSTDYTNGSTANFGTAVNSLAVSFDLARVSRVEGDTTSPSTLAVDANGGNPVSYSLYDGDDVKYWKYLGWEDQDQRWATRHQGNVIIRTDQPVFSNIAALLDHFNGLLTYADGQYILTVETSKDEVTEGTTVFNDDDERSTNIKIRFITQDDIIGNISVKDRGLSKAYNSLSAQISDPQNSFNGRSVSFFDSNYLKEDRGIKRSTNFKLPGITSYFNARMAVKQILDQSRFNRQISFKMRPAGLAILAGDIIRVQYSRYGWEDGKYFRVQNLTLNEDCLVNIVAEEYDDSVYLIPSASDTAFKLDASTEAVTRAPSAPTSLTATTGVTEKVGQINLAWTAPGDIAGAASGRYEIWRADAQSGNVNTLVTAHATLIGTVASPQVTFIDKPEALSGTFYYWVRANNTLPIQTTSSRETRSYYSDFTSNSNTGVVGSVSAIQQVKLVAEDYSIVYDVNGENPSFTDANDDDKILLTASTQGYTSPQFRFVVGGTELQDWSTTNPVSWTVPSTIFSPSKVAEVQTREGNSGPATQTDSISLVAVKSGVDGVTPKVVVVTPSTNVMFLDFDPPANTFYNPAVVIITAQTTGTTANGAWSTSAGTISTVVNTHTAPSCRVTIPPHFVDGMVVTYTLHADDGSASDSTTLELIETKGSSITPILSNEAHVLPASTEGAVESYAGSGTNITVYEGADKLDYDGTGTTSGHWTVAIGNTANITEGTATSGGAGDERYAIIGSHSAAADGTDVYTITYTITGKASNGDSFSFTKTQTISKSKTGVEGTNAYTVIMPNSSHTVPVNNEGSITFTGSGTNIEVLKGGTELEGIITGDAAVGTFQVISKSVAPSGAFDTTGTDNSGLGAITQAAGDDKHLVVANFTEMNASQDVGQVTYTIDIEGIQEVTQVQTITKSKEGGDGDSGLNNAIAYLYQVGSSNSVAPDDPDGDLTYTFATGVVSGSNFNSWLVTRGATTDANPYRWVIAAPASSITSTDTIATGDWAAAVLDSAEGFQSATVFLYQRNNSASSPAVINNNTTYTFSTKVLSGELDGWTQTIPATGNYIHVTTAAALAINSATTDTIATGDWSTPTILSQKGDTGAGGAASKTVDLTIDDYSIVYDSDGANPSPSGTMTLTASSQNFTDGYFKFTGDDITDEVSFTNGSGANADTFTFTIPTSYFTTPKSLRVGVAEAAASTTEVAFDTITVSAVKPGGDGVDGMTHILTNASHVFPASSAGVVSSYSNSGTIIEVYEGATALLYDGTGTANSSWKTTEAATNITVGSKTDSGAYLTVGNHTGVANGTDTSQIVYTISGKRADGTAFSTTAKQTFTKSKEGADGSPAVNSRYPTLYRKNSNVYDTDGGTFADPRIDNGSWTYSIPALTADGDKVYAMSRIFTSDGNSPQEAAWSTPAVYAQREDGETVVGDDGQGIRQANLYKLNDTSLTSTTAGTFADPRNGNTDWSFSVPALASNGDKVYVATRTFTSDAASPQDAAWSTPSIYAHRTDGDDAVNSRYPTLYRKNSNTINSTSGSFADPRASNTDWTYAIPALSADGDIVYAVSRIFTSDGNSPQESSWSTPAIYAQREDGETITGPAGQGSRFASLYKLNDTSLTSTTAGTFADPRNGNTDWAFAVPTLASNGDKVYVANRLFTSDGSSPQDAAWSTPVIYSQRTDGDAAYAVSLSASKYVIAYDISGAESDSITFTAAPQGIQGTATYKFEVDGTQKQAASTTATYAMADADEPASGAAKLVKVTMYDDTVEKAIDSVSIYGIKEGEDAVTIVMSNESQALPTTSGGTVSYTNSGTDIRVYSGNTPLEYGDADSKFTVSAAVSNITAGAASTVSTYTRRYANASDITAATATITFTISVKNALGVATTFTKIQTLNKTVDGDDGTSTKYVSLYKLNDANITSNTFGTFADPTSGAESGWTLAPPDIGTTNNNTIYVTTRTFNDPGGGVGTWTAPVVFSKYTKGAAGEDAYAVSLSANKYAIAYDEDGDETDSLTFTAAPQGIVGTATYKFAVDGVEKQAAGTSTTYAMADGDEPASGAAKVVEVTMYDNGVSKATDSVSIYGIQDGVDAITIVMTNEAHALPTTNAGAVTYDNSGTDIKVFRGSTQLAYNDSEVASTFKVTASASNITAGAASTVSTYTRRYAVTSSITAATATITFSVVVRNTQNTATTFTKIQTLNKTIDGDTGDTGAAGITSIIEGGMMHMWLSSDGGSNYSPTATTKDFVFKFQQGASVLASRTIRATLSTSNDNASVASTATSGASTSWNTPSAGTHIEIEVTLGSPAIKLIAIVDVSSFDVGK